MYSARPRAFPMPSHAATRLTMRRLKPTWRCSTASVSTAACWCSRAPMAATTGQCSMRSRASRNACAALRSAAAELSAATLKQWHAAGVRGLRANEFRRDGKPYYQNGVGSRGDRAAAAAHRRSRLASAIVDRRARPARPDAARLRACRCRSWSITWAAWSTITAPRMPDSRRCCAASAKANCGRSSRARIGWAQRRRITLEARPFHDALVARQSAQPGLGHRLAASAPRGSGAGCKTSAAMYSSTGRRPPTGKRSWSTTPRGFTAIRRPEDPARSTRPIPP